MTIPSMEEVLKRKSPSNKIPSMEEVIGRKAGKLNMDLISQPASEPIKTPEPYQRLRERNLEKPLGKGAYALGGLLSGVALGIGADKLREEAKEQGISPHWVTGGEIVGSLLPFGAAYRGASLLTKGITNPIKRAVATGLIGDTPLGMIKGGVESFARGEKGSDVAKSALKEGALYGGAAAVLGPLFEVALPKAVSSVLKRFKGKPVATETIEREVAKDIGVEWGNLNEAQKKAIREKVIAQMQGEPVASGRVLPKAQEFTMLDPLKFKKQVPKTFFERTVSQKQKVNTVSKPLLKPEFEFPGIKDKTPIAARDFKNVGNRSIKAISYENPRLKPFYQEEANNLLGELKSSIKGERYSFVDEMGNRSFGGTKKYVSETIETIQNLTNATYKEIEKALEAIIKDKGRENNALSKRIELIIDENLTNGYRAFDGTPISPNKDYIELKQFIENPPRLKQGQLALPPGQEFQLAEPPLKFKKTIEVPRRKLQPDLTPPKKPKVEVPQIKPKQKIAENTFDIINTKLTSKALKIPEQSVDMLKGVKPKVRPKLPALPKNQIASTAELPKLENADTFRAKINRGIKQKPRTFAEIFEKIRTNVVDDLAALEGLEKRIRGKIASAEDSLYKQGRLFRGVPEKAYNIVNTQLKPIINNIEKQGFTYQDLGDYALAVHAKDVNARGINSGFTDAEIDAVLRKYANTPLEQARQQLIQLSDNMLKELVDSEVISKETYKALKEKWPNYMPLFRSFDDNKVEFTKGLSKALANVTSPIKKLEGSSRDVIDPIESMIKNIFNITNTAQRNKVALQLAKLAEEDTQGLIRKLAPNEEVGRKNVVSVLRNGEKVRYEVEPEVYKALLNLNKEGSNLLIKLLSKPASLLRAGATLTPEFSLRNPLRDIPFAFTVSKSKLNPLDIGFAFLDVISKGKWSSKLYNQWLQDLGGYGNIISMDRNVHRQALEEALKKPVTEKFVTVINPKTYLKLLRRIADISESTTKLAEYRAALRQGTSREEAAYRSRDIMDFARAGSSVREANKIIAFLNANIQGKSKLWRALQENPTGVTVRALASVTLPTIAFYAANHKFANEKQKETIKDAPAWLKNTFWLVAIPGTDLVARIPKPFDLAPLFANFYERLLDKVVEKDPKAFDNFIRETLDEQSIPVIPTALLPILEGMANKSFFRDAPIIPQREQDLRYPDQYDINTSETAKFLAKGVDKLTGGTGPFKNFGSPRVIDNTIRGYTAGLGSFGLGALDVIFEGLTGVDKPEKPTKKITELPVARAFFANQSGPGKAVEYIYDELDKLRRAKGSAKEGKGTFKEMAKLKFLEERAKKISEISKQMRQITNSPKFSGDEKREKLEKLNELRNRIARNAKRKLEKGN